jgi:hypothetical protein
MPIFHYTNIDGHNAISSQPDWKFRALKPPGPHPIGAYFTQLLPNTRGLCRKLLIPRAKIEFVFEFGSGDDLISIEGGRRQHVAYSPVDYIVTRASHRQTFNGRSEDHPMAGGMP